MPHNHLSGMVAGEAVALAEVAALQAEGRGRGPNT